MIDTQVSCSRIPSHQHINVWSLVTGTVDGVLQREIYALNVRSVLDLFFLCIDAPTSYALLLFYKEKQVVQYV